MKKIFAWLASIACCDFDE